MSVTKVVISFPKSGRTWLRFILEDLGVEATYSHARSEHKAMLHFSELSVDDGGSFDRVVFMHRDPRDTAVSWYYQATRRNKTNPYSGTIAEFIRDPYWGVEKIARFNLLWLGRASQSAHIHAISYEGLHKNAFGEIAAVLRFFGERVPASKINKAIAANSFGKLHEMEKDGVIPEGRHKKMGATITGDANSLKFRKGKVGGYRDELSADDIEWCDTTLQRLGYSNAI